METIKTGKYVKFAYDLFELEGGNAELMLSKTKDDPEAFVFGLDENMVSALSAAMEGKTVGDKFEVNVEPANGFGERRNELVMELPIEMFEVDGKFDDKHVYQGADITMMTAEGMPAPGTVLVVTDKNVTVDFNHPLAGKTVRFNVEIIEVRDATEADKHPSCGGCHGCGDDHGCSGCGDGCCH